MQRYLYALPFLLTLMVFWSWRPATTAAVTPTAEPPPDSYQLPVTSYPLSTGDLALSTFLGGSGGETAHAVVVAADGTIYVAGETSSGDFPTTPGVFDRTYNGNTDLFVARLSSDGSQLLFGTYVGGGEWDIANGMAVDSDGSAYLVGTSSSGNFPVTAGAYDPTFNGDSDGVLIKLTDTGALVYSTFLGGGVGDSADAIALDGAGAIYVIGYTSSPNFPTTLEAFDSSYNGGDGVGDAFVTKLNPAGDALLYSTFLGGPDDDDGNRIVVDNQGNAYLTGWTSSSTFPTTPGAFDTTFAGIHDAFVTKLNAAGSGLVYSGLLGGFGNDQPHGLAVDGAGAVYVTGHVSAGGFPVTPGAFDTTLNGSWDGFVTKISPAGDALVYSTFLGGSSSDCELGGVFRECPVAVGPGGIATVAGRTSSADFPTTPDGYDTTYNEGEDAFVVQLSAAGDALVYGSFLGGTSGDSVWAMAVSAGGVTHVSGNTSSTDFPTTSGSFDTSYNGGSDAFVTRLDLVNFCGNEFAIPDGDPAGASSSVVITDTAYLLDLDVSLSVEHPFVGDLVATLTHEETGTTIPLMDRPGGPPPPYCDGDDVAATLDDEADSPIEDECDPGAPSIAGRFTPQTPLSAVDLEQLGGTWTLNVADVEADNVGQVTEWCLLPTTTYEPISLVKTVGTDRRNCAMTKEAAVYAGAEVTYCYQVRNNSPLTLGTHDLADSELGTLLSDFRFELEAGATTYVTATAVITQTTVNSATWTTYSPLGLPLADSDTASVLIIPEGCNRPLLAIPDGDPAGTTNDLTLTGTGLISDLDVYLLVEHTWVGDLQFWLQHQETGRAVALIDRPGHPPPPSCSGDNIEATLDDEALDPVEDECASSIPTIDGRFIPYNRLAAFDNETLAGTWTLTATDTRPNEIGRLVQWCVVATVREAELAVTPAALTSTQTVDTVATLLLTLSNDGEADLTWTMDEPEAWAAVTPDAGTILPGDSAPVEVTFDASGLALGVYTSTLAIHGNDPDQPLWTVAMTMTVEPPPPCATNCLRVEDIQMRGRQFGDLTGAEARVRVVDENGDPVPNATVYVRWEVSGGGWPENEAALTNWAGIARLAHIAGLGAYTIVMDTVVKPGYTFDPDNSVLSASITLPPDGYVGQFAELPY
ncbi:MAG: SBBP repeat-containing protein [Chloroflexota bacterium]